LLLTAKNLRFQATPPDTAQTKTFLRWRRVETAQSAAMRRASSRAMAVGDDQCPKRL
jgi:hypothetical protein